VNERGRIYGTPTEISKLNGVQWEEGRLAGPILMVKNKTNNRNKQTGKQSYDPKSDQPFVLKIPTAVERDAEKGKRKLLKRERKERWGTAGKRTEPDRRWRRWERIVVSRTCREEVCRAGGRVKNRS